MPFAQGQVLNNRYRIVKLIGQGGFGAVYRAWDTAVNQVCALKENLDTSVEAQRQFQREANILAGLRHPNLPRVTDHFFIPGQGQYLVMDFVEGEDLQAMLDRLGPLPESQVLPWIEQVCEALTYLHSQTPSIIHRDIKPGNIKIQADGRAMLVDFGIAKVYDPQMSTTTGARAVSPGYSPPEQYGNGKTDARSDVYALGATLYTLLTGQVPPESVQRMTCIIAITPPRQLNQAISPAMEQTIIKATDLAANYRFQTMAELRASLPLGYRQKVRPPTLPLASIPSRTVNPHPKMPIQPQPIQSPVTPPFLNKYGLLMGFGLVIVIFILGGIMMLPVVIRPGNYYSMSSSTPNANIPIVIITTPANGSQIQVNQPINVQATASDPSGVRRLELWVSSIKSAEAVSPVEQGQATLTASFLWGTLASGIYTLEVKAFNVQHRVSTPTTVTVNVTGAIRTATSIVTSTPAVPSVPSLTTKTDLNVRSGPGIQYDLLGLLPAQVTVEITGRDETGQWWQIRFSPVPDGIGWVASDPAFSTSANRENVPIASTPPTPTSRPVSRSLQPKIGSIIFAWGATDTYKPINPATSFKEGVTEIHAIFEYSGMSKDHTWERVWYLDGKEVLRSVQNWSGDETGVFDCFIDAGGEPLFAGKWDLELYVQGTLLSTGTFTIVK